MHIPDGFIDAKTAAVTAALSVVGVGLALRHVRREMPPAKVPLLGLAAAFLFAAQLVNFPVAGGTSGHLLGGALTAALLGPGAAIIVLTTVLIVQCLLFADGGVLALGANVFNMAIVGAGAGGVLYRLVSARLPGRRGRVTALAFAGWCSVVLASVSCAGQLAWSGTVSWPAAFTAMSGVHILIGVGEGLISAIAFAAIQRARPDLVVEPAVPSRAAPQSTGRAGRANLRRGWPYALIAAVGLAVFVGPFACPWPDGLEAVAARLGFEEQAARPLVAAAAPEYRVPGVHWAAGAIALAGAAGTIVVFGLAFLIGRWLVPGSEEEAGG